MAITPEQHVWLAIEGLEKAEVNLDRVLYLEDERLWGLLFDARDEVKDALAKLRKAIRFLEDAMAGDRNGQEKRREEVASLVNGILNGGQEDLPVVRSEAHGLPIVIRVVPTLLHWTGYVGIPKEHPYYGKADEWESPLLDLEVHGGVTWADDSIPGVETDPGYWWIGFDCGHVGDWSPWAPYGHRWTQDEVLAEARHLADQLAALGAMSGTGEAAE